MVNHYYSPPFGSGFWFKLYPGIRGESQIQITQPLVGFHTHDFPEGLDSHHLCFMESRNGKSHGGRCPEDSDFS